MGGGTEETVLSPKCGFTLKRIAQTPETFLERSYSQTVAEAGQESSPTQTFSTSLCSLFVEIRFIITQIFDLRGQCGTTQDLGMGSDLQFMSSIFCFHSLFQNIYSSKLAIAQRVIQKYNCNHKLDVNVYLIPLNIIIFKSACIYSVNSLQIRYSP